MTSCSITHATHFSDISFINTFIVFLWFEAERAAISAMATTSFLHLLVIFLGFYNLLCSTAVPTSRTVSLMHGSEQFLHFSSNTHMVTATEEKVRHGRMVVALNDYPGSGANNRHTPRPQFRGCDDC